MDIKMEDTYYPVLSTHLISKYRKKTLVNNNIDQISKSCYLKQKSLVDVKMELVVLFLLLFLIKSFSYMFNLVSQKF